VSGFPHSISLFGLSRAQTKNINFYSKVYTQCGNSNKIWLSNGSQGVFVVIHVTSFILTFFAHFSRFTIEILIQLVFIFTHSIYWFITVPYKSRDFSPILQLIVLRTRAFGVAIFFFCDLWILFLCFSPSFKSGFFRFSFYGLFHDLRLPQVSLASSVSRLS